VVDTADDVFATADMVVKVKEPQSIEIARLRPGQVLFTYLHLAADRAQTEGLLRSGGTNAARVAMGMEASVAVIDKSLPRLKELDLQFGAMMRTLFATAETIEQEVCSADLVIGAVLLPGAAAPKLITRAMVRQMRPGSVLVDIAIDQGGCSETSRPTTHAEPTYVEEGVVHYCVTNMPGAVARTSTIALNNATLPFVLALADKGWRQAMREDPHLAEGLNIHEGRVTHSAVARDLGLDYSPTAKLLGV
jgi:alanine dehydrogenase